MVTKKIKPSYSNEWYMKSAYQPYSLMKYAHVKINKVQRIKQPVLFIQNNRNIKNGKDYFQIRPPSF